ncbi:MAG: Holliday junction branch migration protein RuvA [Hyphomicrobiaceae bacterium]
MIGKLRGLIEDVGEDWVILDVGGVGYEGACSGRTLAWLQSQTGEVTLAIETHVREDAIRLFGFRTSEEREWFRLLQTVQGVGAKVALAVMGALAPADIANAIALQDKTAIRAPHVGPKLAARIVAELKDKAPALTAAGVALPQGTGVASGAPAGAADGPARSSAEAISALVNLGYPQMQASSAVSTALKELGAEARTEQLIRRGLRELAR